MWPTRLNQSGFILRLTPAIVLLLPWTFVSGCNGTSGSVSQPPPAVTYSIQGQISPVAGGDGAAVTLSGGARSQVTADNSGSYSFTGISNGGYAVTPSKTGYSFNPSSQTVTVSGASVTGINFSAAADPFTYKISGTISPASAGAGSLVTLSGSSSGSTTTDGSGNYSFIGLSNGTYTITPSSQTATFSPTSQLVTVNNGSATGIDFTATKVFFFDDFTGTSLSSAWTVISRHGEYAQNETECNIPQEVSVANSLLTITTAQGPATCGDFNVDGSVRHAPASWPYITGDIQWKSLSFTYGTVTFRAKFPAQSTGLWPAIWLLGTNCQNTNPFTADVGYDTCPALNSANYTEIDITECDLKNWCQLALANLANAGSGGQAFPTCGYPVDTNFHTFALSWTVSSISVSVDGQPTGCSYSSPVWTIPSTPMFLLIQTQTGGDGGAPNNAELPVTFQIDYVKITQP